MTDLVLYENRGPAAILTLNRPEQRNAFDAAMTAALRAAVERLEADPSARVGVLTGAGTAFSAGMDLQALLDGEGDAILFGPGHFAGFVEARRTKPVIAAVEGAALAGGFEIVLACDLIVASKTAVFGLPEAGVGLFAVGGGAFRLGRRIPTAKALELCLTGERLPVAEAERLGLLNEVVDAGHALPAALDLAERIARSAPLAVSASLELARASRAADEHALWSLSDQLWSEVGPSADAQDGPRAFKQKRRAIWKGM